MSRGDVLHSNERYRETGFCPDGIFNLEDRSLHLEQGGHAFRFDEVVGHLARRGSEVPGC